MPYWPRKRYRRSYLLALAAPLTVSCGVFGGAQDAKLRSSPNFQIGYSDGCAAATQQGADLRNRIVQDPTLYKTDPAYRAGWSNGFESCRTTNMPAGTQPGGNPLGGPLPGTH